MVRTVNAKLALRGIEKRYGDNARGPPGLDLELKDGGVSSRCSAPSGCGKTTDLADDRGAYIRTERRATIEMEGPNCCPPPAGVLPPEKAADVDDLPELRGVAEHDGGGRTSRSGWSCASLPAEAGAPARG